MKRLPAEQAFRLVHPCDVGMPLDEHKVRHCRYLAKCQRYSGIRWADGLEGFVVWPALDRAPSPQWLGWARFWAELDNPQWLRSRVMH